MEQHYITARKCSFSDTEPKYALVNCIEAEICTDEQRKAPSGPLQQGDVLGLISSTPEILSDYG